MLVHGFRVMAESLDAFRQLDECAEACHAQDLALDDVADLVGGEERLPNIGLKLLHSERKTAVFRLDAENDGLHAIALLQHFGRMLNAFGPAQVAYVDQSVDTIFDLDEGTEVGE